MARGSSVNKLIFLLSYAPSISLMCSLSTNFSSVNPPWALNESVLFAPYSPVDVMHTAQSLFSSAFTFLLLGFDFSASAVLPRQASTLSPSTYNTRFPSVTWDNDLWRVTTTALDQGHYQSRQSIANGYIGMSSALQWVLDAASCCALLFRLVTAVKPTGLSVAALGPFFEADSPVDGDNINGWPLFSERQTFGTISGFFDQQVSFNRTSRMIPTDRCEANDDWNKFRMAQPIRR